MRFYFTNTVDVFRLVAGSNNTESYSGTKNGSIACSILSFSPDDIILSEGNPATSAILVCDNTEDIKVTDKIVDGTDTYIIKYIKTPKQLATIQMKRCIIEKMNS